MAGVPMIAADLMQRRKSAALYHQATLGDYNGQVSFWRRGTGVFSLFPIPGWRPPFDLLHHDLFCAAMAETLARLPLLFCLWRPGRMQRVNQILEMRGRGDVSLPQHNQIVSDDVKRYIADSIEHGL